MKDVVNANMIRGLESVGGRLHFESHRMVFRPHLINIQRGGTVVPYADIASVRKRNTLGLVPNGLLVTTKDGDEYKLVVWNRSKIIAFLDEQARR